MQLKNLKIKYQENLNWNFKICQKSQIFKKKPFLQKRNINKKQIYNVKTLPHPSNPFHQLKTDKTELIFQDNNLFINNIYINNNTKIEKLIINENNDLFNIDKGYNQIRISRSESFKINKSKFNI